MKKILSQTWMITVLLLGLLAACSNQPKDSKIQGDFEEKAKVNPQLATVRASVNDGVLTLSGQCPDETCRTSAEQAAREVKGVKSVVNNITVTQSAPVVIADDATLENSVKEVIDDYKDVDATVNNGEITLRGSISRDNLQKLMMQLNEMNPKKINNQLTIK